MIEYEYENLVLDDNKDLVEVMNDLLLDICDCNVLVAYSYNDVVKTVSEHNDINIAFLDINFGVGEKSGVDVYHWLRSNSYSGKIIFLTGHVSGYPALKQILETPNTMLLEKPASVDIIEKAIRE